MPGSATACPRRTCCSCRSPSPSAASPRRSAKRWRNSPPARCAIRYSDGIPRGGVPMECIQFNPMDPEFVADPYPTYHRLRAEDPVHESAMGFWVLTRYEDVVATLRDPRFAKEPLIAAVAARMGIQTATIGLSMLDRDPPDHTRLRG